MPMRLTGAEQEETEAHVCGPDPWLVLHKIESPTKMRYIGERFAECPQVAAEPKQPAVAGAQGRVQLRAQS